MKIDELLDKYFEGGTSCEEEREIRRFFAQEEIPGHLEMYRPLFTYLAQERKTGQETNGNIIPPERKKGIRLHRLFRTLGGIAAGVLLLTGIAHIVSVSYSPENYVIIDGKRYTDDKLVQAKALEALQNAGFTDEDLSNLLFQH